MFNGTNLLDIHAPNFKKYALKVAHEIFTTDELVNSVILEENEKKITTRADAEKVSILKSKIEFALN